MKSSPVFKKQSAHEPSKEGTTTLRCKKKFKAAYDAATSRKSFKENEEESPLLLTPFALMRGATSSAASIELLRAATSIDAIFEEMLSSMTYMDREGIAETTFYVDAQDSMFSGIQITIKEFNTAPKIFNVEIAGHTEAVVQLQANLGALVEAFNSKEHKFKINRLETKYAQGKYASTKQIRGEEKDERASTLSMG